jgi:hypothetical protein
LALRGRRPGGEFIEQPDGVDRRERPLLDVESFVYQHHVLKSLDYQYKLERRIWVVRALDVSVPRKYRQVVGVVQFQQDVRHVEQQWAVREQRVVHWVDIRLVCPWIGGVRRIDRR